jgi:acyl dehydratase
MEDASVAISEASPDGRITPEGVEALRRKIGIDWPYTRRSTWNEEAGRDAIRHYAFGLGDDNPLFWDPEYAAGTRWGTIIAPPLFLECAGITPPIPMSAEQRAARSSGGLADTSLFWAGDRITFYNPVVEGDRIYVRRFYADVTEKTSSTTFGRTVVSVRRRVFTNGHGALVAIWDADFIHAEKKRAGTVRGPGQGSAHEYSDEELGAIDEAYAAETIRGNEARFAEDVVAGEELPSRVKGPLTVSDMIAWLQGAGRSELYPYRLQYKSRQRVPAFLYPRNAFRAYEPMLRGHYDREFARSLGLQGAYDFGAMRCAWMVQIVTDWMGDDAIIVRAEDRMKAFSGVGDVVHIRGKVEDCATSLDWPVVRCAIECTNREGEAIATGMVDVRLPSRTLGKPPYPAPPADGGLLPGMAPTPIPE